MVNRNRHRGILTKQDAEILSKSIDTTDSLQRDAIYRIRQRTIKGVLDFSLLSKGLRDGDIELIFDEILEDDPRALNQFLYLVYTGIQESEHHYPLSEDTEEQLENIVYNGIRTYSSKNKELLDINVDISVDTRDPTPDVLRHQIIEGKGNYEELRYLLDTGEAAPLLRKIVSEDLVIPLQFELTDEELELTPKRAKEYLE